MAVEEAGTSRRKWMVGPTREDPYAWIAEEARERSILTKTFEPKFTVVEERMEEDPENWAAYVLKEGQRVYSDFGEHRFAMYEFVFEKLGVRMPFSEFAMAVFDHLHLAPSQLNPNSIGFIWAYELVCKHQKIVPSVPVFFVIFQIQRKSKGGRQCWVSLKSKVKLFEMFVDSVCGFKSRYYIVGAVSEEAKKSLYRTVTEEVNGEQVSRLKPKFPLSWTFDHFLNWTDSYLTKVGGLSEQERADLKRLQNWVDSFVLGPCVYKMVVDGKRVTVPYLGKDGKQVFAPRFIDTKRLLSCKSDAARQILLDQMAQEGT
ncbi:hypothetical protein A2U01_0000472 [Trifolium medium]|uniref:Transposase (putative) gypsy type domain-containing protein n=1 Tax=Trifolium medium TaxID=97028 RepID=A0A392LXM8_9FABA|nr:hypothetical protein [Trifolium medium]